MAVEEKQAGVLEQPKDQKVYLDVQYSTDTTAIWSFVIAMVVAFILGVSATIIAIWYGRRSFKLTEMSFKTVVDQIKASEKSARDLNEKLFEQQRELLGMEFNERSHRVKVKDIKNAASKFIATINKFILEAERFQNANFDSAWNRKNDSMKVNFEESFTILNTLNNQAVLDIALLEVNSNGTHDFNEIINIGNLLTWCIDNLLEDYKKDKVILEDFEIPINLLQDLEQEFGGFREYKKLKAIGFILIKFNERIIGLLNEKAA